jgi:hypothetical protein
MYYGSLYHGDIIAAFQRHVPGVYVRDYREQGGFITICRYYKDIPWKGTLSTKKVERQVPAITLVSLPRGYVTAPTRYKALRLDRPGWRQQFRRAKEHLTEQQMRAITEDLGETELFPGIVVH